MIIDDGDFNMFQFVRFLNSMEQNEEGTALLCDYWKHSHKLDKLMLLIKNQDLHLKIGEIQYLIAAENCCENLYRVLDKFLSAPYLETNRAVDDAENVAVIANANVLIQNMKGLKEIRLHSSWETFFGELSMLASTIINTIDRIISSGKSIHFRSKINADKVLSGAINYNNSSEIDYFIFQNKRQFSI